MQSYHPYPHPHHHTHTPPHTVQTIEKIIEVPIVKEIIKEIPNVEAETKINELVEKLKQSETQKAELWTNLDYLLNKHENDQIKAKETIKKTLSDELKKQEELIIKIKEKDEEIDTLKKQIAPRIEEIALQVDGLQKNTNEQEEKPQSVYDRLYQNAPRKQLLTVEDSNKKKDTKKQQNGKKL